MKTLKFFLITGVVFIILYISSAACIAQVKGIKNNPSNWTGYQPKVVSFDQTLNKDKETLSDLLKTCWIVSGGHTVSYKNVEINNDNVQIALNKTDIITINFADFDYGLSVSMQQWEQHYKGAKYYIQLGDNCTFSFDRSGIQKAKDLCDILFTVQHRFLLKSTESQLVSFKSLAEQYHKRVPKPVVSEEQRKFIVQANLFSKEKEYIKAIGMYKKVIELDPTAYPEAYYNIALLYAMQRLFDVAILNMKEYLLLLPEAPDARAAQDKIYEWETEINQ